MTGELKIIHLNTQGFQNKINNINNFVKVHKPDILVVTEHFQKNAGDLENISGYKMINSFCRKHNEKGGVAIWAKPSISCRPRKDLDLHRKEKEFELVSVSVEGDIVVTGVYRPPSTSIQDFYVHLQRYMKKINKEPQIKHVLTGDFNIDNRKPNKTRNVLNQNDLKFHLTSKTHRNGRCIDNFITNFETPRSRVIKSKISDFSDHHPIEIIICNKASMIRQKPDSILYKKFMALFDYKTETQVSSDTFDKDDTEKRTSLAIVYDIFSYVFNKITHLTTTESRQPSNISKTYQNKKTYQQSTQSFSFFNSIISFITPNWFKSEDKKISVSKNYSNKSNKSRDSKKDNITEEHSFFSMFKYLFSSIFDLFNNSSEDNSKPPTTKTLNNSHLKKKRVVPSVSFFSRFCSFFT